ncbi:MAG: hypothetical protein QM725_02835 [Lacibacter sp.]
MNFKTNLQKASLNLFVFSFFIFFFLIILFTAHNKTGEWQLFSSFSKSIPFMIGIGIVTIPGFILHLKYYLSDKGKSLKSKSGFLEISNANNDDRVNYSEIKSVRFYKSLWTKFPWSDYCFIRINLKNGEVICLTSLLFDPINTKILFKQMNIPVEESELFFPWPFAVKNEKNTN